MKLRIGSRDSLLAVIQSRLVMDALQAAHPGIELELVTMKTTGDKILDRTLDQVGGKGLFVKELDAALQAGRVDLTVHSCKDLPMELPEGLPIAAFLRREDPRDVLALPEGAAEWDVRLPAGSASPRRRVQLRELFPAAEVRPVRGNVQTRLRKLDEGGYGALILAAAGMKRLGLERRISRYFEPEELLPAAGQGILAVQCRADMDRAVFDCLRDREAEICALAERAFVQALDGGCSSPIAAYARMEGDNVTVTGMYVDGTERVRKGAASGPAGEGEALARALAKKLKEDASCPEK
ncbi:MAG: hydroxymethylbilane synthase [Oscillospiraceae bacterium]|jgi:hydroxymethylbilane synthase|nr:hydroxymethylbilane synthase [Oscillospiraceae bacterium]